MKRCNTCGELKEVNADNFQRQAKARDGFKNECKDCSKKKQLEYRSKNHKVQAIYTEDDHYQKVEDDRYKIKMLDCMTGCGRKIETLIDTHARSLPRKLCGICKADD